MWRVRVGVGGGEFGVSWLWVEAEEVAGRAAEEGVKYLGGLAGVSNPSPTPPLEREGLLPHENESPSLSRGGVGEGFAGNTNSTRPSRPPHSGQANPSSLIPAQDFPDRVVTGVVGVAAGPRVVGDHLAEQAEDDELGTDDHQQDAEGQ